MSIQAYFLLRPDWAEKVTASRRWITSVITSVTGAEQRSKLKTRVTRKLKFTASLLDKALSSYAHRVLFASMHQVLGVPWWVDPAWLTAQGDPGESVLAVDATTDKEFSAGRRCVLVDPDDPTLYECHYVQSLTANSLTLRTALAGTWAVGTEVYPLFGMRTQSPVQASLPTAGMSRLDLELEEAYDVVSQSTTTTTTSTSSTSTTTTSSSSSTSSTASTTSTASSTSSTSSSSSTTSSTEPISYGSNLLGDSGFEENDGSWELENSPLRHGNNPKAGSYCMRLYSSLISSLTQTVAVSENSTYRIAAWAKRLNGDIEYGPRYHIYDLSNYVELVATKNFPGVFPANEWAYGSDVFDTPAGCESIWVHIFPGSATAGQDLDYDDITLRELL